MPESRKHFKIREYINRFNALSRKRKAAIAVPLICLIALVPFTAYMLSPVDGTQKTSAAISELSNGNENKPTTRAEAILNRILGKEDNGDSNLVSGESSSSAISNTNSNSGSSAQGTSASSVSGNGSDSNRESNNTSGGKPSAQDDGSDLSPVLNCNDWEYKINSANKLEITKYTGNDKNVLVPDQINGTNVERISEKAFQATAIFNP